MLRLKKLQILGFKSFCDRTELKFHGEGMAAVVGPNGCGKSNIADAISWVLGEQSAKSLRGVRMEDVIFAGTRDRKPTGMAEVSLTLIDPEVYDGPVVNSPEIELENELPEDDWDEASIRAVAADDVEAAVLEAQPGQVLGQEDEAAAPPVEAEASNSEDGRSNVVLKIRRRRFKPAQFKAGEIVVTRRLFRSGESEYLLNGKICRLRDIQEIFMGTGLGPESYAIIEQGRIGQILSSKPHDRRAIIEEAAGITKYKTKKRLAEARLEQARLNLSRVNDIFEEVTRQMNSLKRQAAKAERYARLRDEMRDKLRVVLASRFAQLERETAEVQQALQSVGEEINLKAQQLASLEQQHSEMTTHGYALEQEIAATRDSLNTIRMESERAQARRVTNEERCAELLSRIAGWEAELARTQEHLQSLLVELASNQAILESATADVAAAQQEAQLRQQEANGSALAVAEAERSQEGQRAAVIDAMNEANRLRNQITQSEENVFALDRESTRLQQEISVASADIASMGGKRGQLGLEFESVSQRVSKLTERSTGVRHELVLKRHEEVEAKRHLDSLRAEYATALGKRNSLQAVIAEHGYSTESVRRLFQSGGLSGGRTPAGVLADFLEVDDKYESVVEDFLRDELNFVVVKSWDAADEGLRLLRSDVDGRATFLVHPSDAQAKFSFAVPERTAAASQPASIIPLKNCIRVLNGFGKSLEVILPKLRDGYIAQDSQTARDLALGNPDAFFLSPSGETFHNVTVTGGKQRSEGPLSLKRELRDLLKQMGELESAMATEETRTRRLAREIEELNVLQTKLDQELREAEREAMTRGHALTHLESEIARIEDRIQGQRLQLDSVAAQKTERQEAIAQRRDELAAAEQRRMSSEAAVIEAQQQLVELKTTRDTVSRLASEASARLAALEERHRAASDGLHRLQTLVTEVRSRTEALTAQMAAANAEQQQRTEENVQLQERIIAYQEEEQAAAATVTELHAVSEQLRLSLLGIEQQVKTVRAEMDLARDRRGELGAAAAKLQSDTAHLGETCLNELGIQAAELCADVSIARLESDALAIEENLCRDMKARLDGMGPVNMMALEEYNETAQRHQFLETQRRDLLESIENTQNTIHEIDMISREKFEEAFHKINENFQRTFIKLFGGGQAFMRLTDQENSTESGIDIVASPPGKKLQNVLLLSGGEKALTALSLLVGIFQYQPSPFCILDEVDAPLDEANVGRFAEMVKEMSAHTQFILITHSKRTMSASPVLYGVTMQEPGVSKVVSVRFGEQMPQSATA